MFSNLSQGSLLHILKIKDGVKYYACPIEQINIAGRQMPTVFNMGQSIDISVTMEGKKKEFSGIVANSSVSSSPEYIITDSKETMVPQVKNVLKNNEDIVNNYNIYNQNISECKNILKDLSPSFAKESAMDNAIAELTERVNKIQDDFGGIKGDVKKVLSLLTNESISKN